MRSLGRVVKRSSWRKGIAYLLTCCVLLNTSLPAAFALELGDMTGTNNTVDTTFVSPTAWGDHTVIDTAHGAIIDWSTFDTSATTAVPDVTQSVTFNQYDVLGGDLSSTSAVLNRITTPDPGPLLATQFDGALNANGRVFVVNPAGVMFGGTASVNVTQLVASGLHMSNFDAIVDGTATEMIFEGGAGEVENRGFIEATEGIHLVGKKVANLHVLRAPGGLIVLAGGDVVRIARDGSNVFVDLLADPGGATLAAVTDAENRSLISASDGKIVLAAADTFGRAVGHAGQMFAARGTVRMQAARVNDRGPIVVSAPSWQNADGGNVELIGSQEVIVGEDKLGIPADIAADGGRNGNGGNITLESAGTVTLEAGTLPHVTGGREDVLVTAAGGGDSGDGGHIKIIADNFSIAAGSIIDASPQDATSNPGILEIETPTVVVANGANTGVTDTVFEEDIETLSTNGTSVVVRGTGTNTGVTVEDIADDQITGGRGGVELHATGANGSVSFADTADSISTTHGNIAISAGSGGVNIGSLETGDPSPRPGQITLTSANGGDITAQNLTIRAGRGHAEIAADASGDLTINGDIIIGRDVPIQDVTGGSQAEAIVSLSAGDHIVLNGTVTASSRASVASPGGVTTSRITVFADTLGTGTGDVTINGNLTAKAVSNANGTSDALVHVDTPNRIIFASPSVLAIADGDDGEVHVEGQTSDIDTNPPAGDVAEIIINQVLVSGLPDIGSTHMGTPLEGNVLDNDGLTDPTAALDVGPDHAVSFSLNSDGSYSYTPEAGYVGDDTFTYTASAEGETSGPILVTITMNNALPTAADATTSTHMGSLLNGTLDGSISDADGDPLTTGLVTGTTNGTLSLNADGSYSYQPDAGYVGPDTFTYSVADPEAGAEPALATVTINMTNTPPVLVGDLASTQIATPVAGNVLANDVDADGDPLTSSLVSGPANASAFQLNADGSFSYTPEAGFIGQDTFTYSATDPQIEASPGLATVTITVSEYSVTAPPAAPGVDVRIEPQISGSPALVKWVSTELGVAEKLVDVWFANTLASARNITPFYSYANFKKAAKILQDTRGVHASALSQVVDEYASSTAPPTEEQMASIAGAISSSAEPGSVYALAGAYVNSLEDYTNFLVNEMGFSQEDAIVFITTKYVDRLAEKESVGLAAYVAAELAGIFTDSLD